MIYAMSDIHGYIDEFKQKMELVDLSSNNRLILLGDYIDYGKDSGQVIRYIYDLQQRYGSDKVIVLKGNHEDMLLEWISIFNRQVSPKMEVQPFDSWFKADSEQGYITFRTLISKERFEEFTSFEKKASYAEINAYAARMLYEADRELIAWLKSLKSYYETQTQIFVHAGVDEEAEEYWKWGTPDDMFLWKYPGKTGHFCKEVIAGHIGTATTAQDKEFHDIFHDEKSHYYIDGTVYGGGKLLLLAYDEEKSKYYQIEKNLRFEVKKHKRKD